MDCATNPVDKLGTCQNEYITSIKNSIDSEKGVKVLYSPEVSHENGIKKPKAAEYYAKPCYVFAPHIQYPNSFKNFKCDECGECSLKSKGWQSNPIGRYVHDIDTSVYLVSRVYICSFCSKSGPKKTYSFNNLFHQLPNFIKVLFPFTLTQKSGYTDRLLSLLVTGCY